MHSKNFEQFRRLNQEEQEREYFKLINEIKNLSSFVKQEKKYNDMMHKKVIIIREYFNSKEYSDEDKINFIKNFLL